MRHDASYSALSRPESAVLLIFFGPLAVSTSQQRTVLTELADSLQAHFGSQLRILRINEANYPEVVQCFAVDEIPTFVLVQQGIELLRQEGLTDKDTLVSLIQNRLTLQL